MNPIIQITLRCWGCDRLTSACKLQISESGPKSLWHAGHCQVPALASPAHQTRPTHAPLPANPVTAVTATPRAELFVLSADSWDRDILLSCSLMQDIYLYGAFSGFFLFIFFIRLLLRVAVSHITARRSWRSEAHGEASTTWTTGSCHLRDDLLNRCVWGCNTSTKQFCGSMNGVSKMPLYTLLAGKSSLAKQVFNNEGQGLCFWADQ